MGLFSVIRIFSVSMFSVRITGPSFRELSEESLNTISLTSCSHSFVHIIRMAYWRGFSLMLIHVFHSRQIHVNFLFPQSHRETYKAIPCFKQILERQ